MNVTEIYTALVVYLQTIEMQRNVKVMARAHNQSKIKSSSRRSHMKYFALEQRLLKKAQEERRAARKAYYKQNGTLRGFE